MADNIRDIVTRDALQEAMGVAHESFNNANTIYNVPFVTCSTSCNSAIKEITLPNITLRSGMRIYVGFNDNSTFTATETTNVVLQMTNNGTQQRYIIVRGGDNSCPLNLIGRAFRGYALHEFIFDGTNWRCTTLPQYSEFANKAVSIAQDLPNVSSVSRIKSLISNAIKETYTDAQGEFSQAVGCSDTSLVDKYFIDAKGQPVEEIAVDVSFTLNGYDVRTILRLKLESADQFRGRWYPSYSCPIFWKNRPQNKHVLRLYWSGYELTNDGLGNISSLIEPTYKFNVEINSK